MTAARFIQFQFCRKTYRFYLRPGFSVLCLIFFILFCFLGNWQLHRYHYKKNLQTLFEERIKSLPRPLLEVVHTNEALQFQQVSARGTYANTLTILIQNQFYHDDIGYEVLTPMQIEGGDHLLLVDRGWIKASANSTLPDIKKVKGQQTINGYIKLLDEHHFILGKNILNTSSYLVMQKMDIEELEKVTHHRFYPFILRLNENIKHGYVRDWVITTVMPERHMGYAVQWFVMAIVLLIAYVCFCCERVPRKRD